MRTPCLPFYESFGPLLHHSRHFRRCFLHDFPNLLQSLYAFSLLQRRAYHRFHVLLTWTLLEPSGVVLYTRYSAHRCTSQALRCRGQVRLTSLPRLNCCPQTFHFPSDCRLGPRMVQPILTGPSPLLTGGRNLDQSVVYACIGRRSIVASSADLTSPMEHETGTTPLHGALVTRPLWIPTDSTGLLASG